MGLVIIHCHILPFMDDGAKDMEVALKMIRISIENKTSGIVATPHVGENLFLAWEEIVNACHRLQQAASDIDLNISIFPGAELAFHLDVLKCLHGPGPYCINGGRYLLVELPLMQIPYFTEDVIFMLQSKGIHPILAHPERNYNVIHDPMILKDWLS